MLTNVRTFFMFLLFSAVCLRAAEYSIKPGDDLQKAVEILQPGDILTLLPGEYYPEQTISIAVQGEAGKPIRIQGAQRHLSVLTSWEGREYTWKAVEGKPFVYKAEQVSAAIAVTELDTGYILRAAPGLVDMEYFRASFFYDKEKQVLYLHCSDAADPALHRIRISTRSGYLFAVKNAAHLQIANLTFTGANHAIPSESRFGSAIRVDTSSHVLIEDCDFYFNSGGVYITFKSEYPTVRNCYFRGNDGLGYGEMAQLFFHLSCSNCLAENNTVVDGRTHGIRFYSGATNVVARGNIVRNERMGLYYKASKEPRLAERNVILDCLESNYNDLVGRPTKAIHNTAALPSQMEEPGEDNLLFNPKFTDPLFCAPDHNDFRLQEDSPFAGKGAYPAPAPVYFVSPQGSDKATGRSVAQAFATLKQAASCLKDGDTLYLLPGIYNGHPLPDGINLRGRDLNKPPRISNLSLANGNRITIDNIHSDKLHVEQAEKMRFNRVSAEKMTVLHSREIWLFRCSLQELRSEDVADSQISFSVLAEGSLPGFQQFYNGPVAVAGPGRHALTRGAADFRSSRPQARIEEIRHEADSDRALIIWTTPDCSSALWNVGGGWYGPRPILSYLEYGTSPDCLNSIPSFGEIFHSLSIVDLVPGQQYFYRIRIPERIFSLTYKGELVEEPERNHSFVGGVTSPVRSFVTPLKDSFHPRTFLVDTSQSLSELSRQVRAGDSIVLKPGIYQDTFRPLASGRPGFPITLKAESSGTVIMDGSANLRPGGVMLEGVQHITIQGLIFRNYSNKLFGYRAGMYYGQVQVYGSENIIIRDCVFLGQGTYQFLIEMREAGNVHILNNVFTNGVNQINGGLNKNIDIIGNTFYYPLIRNILLGHGQKGSTVTVKKNIFLGKSRQKALEAITYGEITGAETVFFDDNIWCFSPEDPYRFCGFENLLALPKEERKQPAGLKRLREKTAYEQNGREIESFRFESHDYLDPFAAAERFKKEFQQPVEEGHLVPTLEFFFPHPDLGLQGYGACPR